MLGKIKKKRLQALAVDRLPAQPLICPICDRLIPAAQKDAHHFIPKSQGGSETRYLHRMCHRQIHSLLTEKELAREFNTPAALRAHPEMQKFINWVKNKPEHLLEKVSKSARLKSS